MDYFAKGGIDEIDFVLNCGDLKSEKFNLLEPELINIDNVCRQHSVTSKCIVETCYLSSEEKKYMFSFLSERTSIDYIKTSTGYGSAGAQIADVLFWSALRQEELPKGENIIQLSFVGGARTTPLKIKAAGGIRDLETALSFIRCGADRLGMSAGVKVMEAWNDKPAETFTERGEAS